MLKSFFKEFRQFAVKGNVVDMAVGIIIGGAFSTIVKSLVNDVIMPAVGLLLGGVDFSDFFVVLKGGADGVNYATLEAAREAGAVTINYGLFLNSVVSFAIVAFSVFLLVRSVNQLKKKEEPKPSKSKQCPECFTDIPKQALRCPNCTSKL